MKLLLSILICQAAGLAGAAITRSSVLSWYPSLARPPLTPPSGVFAPVWTLLYLLMGVALGLIWGRSRDLPERTRPALAVFAVQLSLNVLWSALFFGLRSPGLALAGIALLWIAIVRTIMLTARISTPAALLLAPYLAWVSFAAYLNLGFYLLNR